MQHPVLSVGDRGGIVRVLQQLVSEAEHAKPGLARDGIFGPLTKFAVMRFQRMWNLEVDGVVGAFTWAALGRSRHLPQLAASAPPAPPPAPAAARPAAPSQAPRPSGGSFSAPAPRPHLSTPPARPAAPAAPAAPPAPAIVATSAANQPGGMNEPAWYQAGMAEFMAHHTVYGTADGNARIHEYFKTTTFHPGVGTTESWCSAFANWCMKQAGVQGTHSAAADSWVKWGVELKEPRLGCIMVVHRVHHSKGSSGNHVTFYQKTVGDRLHYFGGNQGKRHAITESSESRSAYSWVHFRWPG